MMGREFVLQYFLKDARCVVGGAITRKDRTQSLSWFTGKAGVLAAVNVQRAVNEKQYR